MKNTYILYCLKKNFKNKFGRILSHLLHEREQGGIDELVQLLGHDGPHAQVVPGALALAVELEQLRNMQV